MLLGYQKKLQMDVSVAKNGKEAVYLHLAGASFDMIIMDDLMPFMDGIEVCLFPLNLIKIKSSNI